MTYKIPLFDLNYGAEEEEAVIKTLRSKWISMGQNVQKLENQFSAHLGIKYAVAVTNCTAALHIALRTLDIGVGDEVIVPSLTFVATANAVRYVGATPVFADITSYENFSIAPEEIERKITAKTKAIAVMHYGGFSCEMDQIMKIAKEHNLFVVEDAAHAPDSEYKGRKLGTIGHIGCFSFFSNKNITCAEGGLLVTNEYNYARKATLLRTHGMTTISYDRAKGHAMRYDVLELGYNYRMDDIRGALLLAQLKRLGEDTTKRMALRKVYIETLESSDRIILPYKRHPYRSSNYVFPILLKESNLKKRENVRQKLAELGIQTSVHYPAVHLFSIYQRFRMPLPKTEYVTDNEITLPLFHRLTLGEIEYISEILKKAVCLI